MKKSGRSHWAPFPSGLSENEQVDWHHYQMSVLLQKCEFFPGLPACPFFICLFLPPAFFPPASGFSGFIALLLFKLLSKHAAGSIVDVSWEPCTGLEAHNDLDCCRSSPTLLPETTELLFVLLDSAGHKNISHVPHYLLVLSCTLTAMKSVSVGKSLSRLINFFWTAGGAAAQLFFSIYPRTVSDFKLLLVTQLPELFMSWYPAFLLEYFRWGFKSLSCCSLTFFRPLFD